MSLQPSRDKRQSDNTEYSHYLTRISRALRWGENHIELVANMLISVILAASKWKKEK